MRNPPKQYAAHRAARGLAPLPVVKKPSIVAPHAATLSAVLNHLRAAGFHEAEQSLIDRFFDPEP